ncbi:MULTISPECIES: hypothetical protein [Nostocales]|uniref:Uncharacterized protein n=3 Tax=Nostocales TaxID=1161 RepID=A0A0C1R8C8_9CYAN|nr:hypothetical protein [Tolypothrix bouteillei]KAF3884139.1 hypothetical protein DA73_0400000470 [Tolypothrix bouteillei VB521301]
MTDSQPPLPQPQLIPGGITSEQYEHYVPEKLEFRNGYLGNTEQDQIGFQLAVLTNMGLLKAIYSVEALLWIEALELYLRKKLEIVDAEPDVYEVLLERLNRAMEDLTVVAQYLED